MRKHALFFLIVVCIVSLIVTACQSNQSPSTTSHHSGQKETTERVVKHLKGETVIKGEPQNVTVLQPFFIDFLLSLGIKPKAAVSAGPHTDHQFSWYFRDQLKGTTNLGWQVNPNLETILKAKPDLILSSGIHTEAYENFSKIAPTVLIEQAETEGVKDWRKTFFDTSVVFGKEDKAKQVIAEYDQRVAESKKKIQQAIGDETVMFLRIKDKELRYYGQKNYDLLYGDLGLKPPAHVPSAKEKQPYQPLALEKLPEINPDHIFLLAETKETYHDIAKQDIWKNLEAVKNNRVYEVDYDLWLQGFGPIANQEMIKQAEEFLLRK